MNSGSTVTAELGLRLVVPEEAILPEDTVVSLVASLCYSADDPYAVHIAFHVGLDEPVEWTFGRELLSEGTEGAAGLGDVKVWPSVVSDSGFDGAVLNIEIASPFGEARFEAPVREVSDFLHRTYQVVPEGRESEHVDIDAELADILGREA